MKTYLYSILAFLFLSLFSCNKQRAITHENKSENTFDMSLFYHSDSEDADEYIFDAHRNLPLGSKISITELNTLFREPLQCDTVKQTAEDWSLYEQETKAAQFLPTQKGDTLIMMRRIYGKQGDWMIWVDLEIKESDSLRVLNVIAYDNSKIEF